MSQWVRDLAGDLRHGMPETWSCARALRSSWMGSTSSVGRSLPDVPHPVSAPRRASPACAASPPRTVYLPAGPAATTLSIAEASGAALEQRKPPLLNASALN